MSSLTPANGGKQWDQEDVTRLLELLSAKVPKREIRLRMGRTQAAIDGRLQRIKLEEKKYRTLANIAV